MTDFSASLTPIVVPPLTSNTAASIASFQGNFTSNIVSTGNSLLAAYIDQKNTDFFTVGDPVTLGLPSLRYGPSRVERPPTSPVIDWNSVLVKIDALSKLAVPAPPALIVPASDTPSLAATAPTLNMPAQPSAVLPPMPTNAPSIDTAAMPDAPSVVLPAVPTFDEFQLPTPPVFSMPSLTTTVPQNLLSPPTSQFSYVDPGYASALQDPLVQKLLNDLQNGTYGIDPNDETMLWFRARDRAAQQARLGVIEAQRRAASTSFPMPQGAMYDAILQEEQKADQIMAEANRDIALRRSELYVEGRKFTINQVREYEQIRMNLYSATQERALNYAKAVVDTGIAIYGASVRSFEASLEAYKAEATVFETKIRAELTKAEIYRAQIAAEQARVDFNRAKIAQYNAQLDGIKTTVELYRSRLEAVNAFLSAQRMKLETFQSQVQVYAATVQAKESEYGMYNSAIRGEVSKVEAYRAQVEAYNASLSGIKTRAEIQLQSNESQIQSYRNASVQYAAQLDSFSKQLSALLEADKAQVQVYGAQVDAYRAFWSSVVGEDHIGQMYNQNILDWNKAVLDSKVRQVDFRFKQLKENVDLQTRVNKDGLEFLRSALGAAASGINSLGVQTS
jgi:hypothetical protein